MLQMVLRNVAMVFGPTLMLPAGSEEYLTAMSHTFAIVELLCKHVSYCFTHPLHYQLNSLGPGE
jgi:hypothetical protein